MLVNIIIGVLVIGLTILIHSYGTIYWIKLIRKKYKKKTTKSLSKKLFGFLFTQRYFYFH